MRLVQRLGHDAECAGGGALALASVGASPPDLVILDVMMPQMDGLEVLARIKEKDATSDVPVVMFSAARDAQTIRLAHRQGAADFWLKGSFDFSELGPRIAALLGTSSRWTPPASADPSRDLPT